MQPPTPRFGFELWNTDGTSPVPYASDVAEGSVPKLFRSIERLSMIRRAGPLADRGAAAANEGSLYVVQGETAPNTARNGFIYYSDGTTWVTVRDPGPIAPLIRQLGTAAGIGPLTSTTSGVTAAVGTITPPASGRLFWSTTYHARQTAAGTLVGHGEITLNGALGTVTTPDWSLSSPGTSTCRTQGYHDVIAGTAYTVAARAAAGAGGGAYVFENHSISIGYGVLLP